MKDVVEYNVEYAHAYVDQVTLSKEQRRSIPQLHEIIARFKSHDITYCTCLWIDDYNPTERRLTESNLIEMLTKLEALPDFIAYESKMLEGAKVLLETIPTDKLLVKHSKSKPYDLYEEIYLITDTGQFPLYLSGKYSCPMLIATWNLSRLSAINFDLSSIQCIKEDDMVSFFARKIINILPSRFKQVELRALSIILHSNCYSNYTNHINHIYY